ncbi:MAG: hypothetical protein ACI87A_003626, partial [Planctomycetota bacterium]
EAAKKKLDDAQQSDSKQSDSKQSGK